MIYFICPANHNHINWATGAPSNDWLCGWQGCGTRLRYSPLFAYIYTKAIMEKAIYSPEHQQIIPQIPLQPTIPQQNPYGGNTNHLPVVQHIPPTPFQPVMPQTMPQTSPGIAMETDTATGIGNTLAPPDFVEMTFHIPIREAQSQETLYPVLEQHGYLFLCRDGQFRQCKFGSTVVDPEETVQEPGVVARGYNGYVTHQFHTNRIMGRNEQGKVYYGAGQISYPDYVVYKDNITYSIELKTPRNGSFKTYLSEHFYIERVFSSGRSIVDELEIRKGLTQSHVEICLLFDVRNIDNDTQVMTDLKNSIESSAKVKHQMTRKQWWENNVKCVIFYKRSGLTKRFTIQEILAGQQMSNTMQQRSMLNYFTSTK